MRVYCIQHVSFEKPAMIEDFFTERGAVFSSVCMSEGDSLWEDVPDVLVVMGGPMGVSDDAIYPWLRDEKAYIERCLKAGIKIIGVCLGAQILASILGASVSRAEKGKEIGWFPVFVSPEGSHTSIGSSLPVSFMAFHWHGDEFSLPPGAVSLFYNHHTQVQGFLWDDRVLALQFHLEVTEDLVVSLVDNCAAELADGGDDVMSSAAILAGARLYKDAFRTLLFPILSDFMSL
ncbi:type 1 glutamine amidotransferase [Spirochaetia bacterium 38H-sp]|uniref:Type 1 glutamine amidotransferase n=1 Tax=Rarispira pelagica TaxID=3141764 RepID=A0ABU9UC27_9SPIR